MSVLADDDTSASIFIFFTLGFRILNGTFLGLISYPSGRSSIYQDQIF